MTGRNLRTALPLASLCGALLFVTFGGGCGEDTCVIIKSPQTASAWTVTFAVTDSSAIQELEGVVVIGADCDDDCGCIEGCDCFAQWVAADDGPACEPLVAGDYEESIVDARTLRFHLRPNQAIVGEGELLRC